MNAGQPTVLNRAGGSTANFAHPYAMTYYGDPSHKHAADKPIRVAQLLDNSTHVHDNQLAGTLTR
ncbi:hypothetical protein [Streptomyces sp. NPDC097610]|uniref:hypothetical protein n=1 Tax=Streptomyces sp. NPDC097610 TaxID=3157227 RepID=UPI00332A26D6